VATRQDSQFVSSRATLGDWLVSIYLRCGSGALLLRRISAVAHNEKKILRVAPRIAEQGRHDELVSGSDAEMFEMQAASYR
jgi:hypothetical protein